jgi:hypothetical protein
MLDIEKTRELNEFLMGQTPPGFHLTSQPKLSRKMAFSVIYVLQEHFGLIPDHFEKCDRCGYIFDSEREGKQSEKRPFHLCDNCL